MDGIDIKDFLKIPKEIHLTDGYYCYLGYGWQYFL